MASIFTRIIAGEVPASFAYQDDQVVAFMDIAPLTEGHLLVVPREETAHLTEIHEQILAHMSTVAKQLGTAIMQADPSVTGINWLLCDGSDAGQEVPHLHLHVIPRRPGDGLRLGGKTLRPPRDELNQWAQRIQSTAS